MERSGLIVGRNAARLRPRAPFKPGRGSLRANSPDDDRTAAAIAAGLPPLTIELRIGETLAANGIEQIPGRARLLDSHTVEIESVRGRERPLHGGATDLIHVGEMALLNGNAASILHENILDFPTLGEAHRIAALHLRNQVLAQAT